MGSRPRAKLALKSKWAYVSPLQGELIEAWTRKGGDPDLAISEWVKEGTPLGVNMPIQCHGIFPAFDREQEEEWQADAITQLAAGTLANYVSVRDNREDAEIEIRRISDKGFAVPVRRREVETEFSQGTISRLALIIKERPDKTKKRRLIIDLRRSGGNSKAYLPEKLVLPRAVDGVNTLRALHQQRAEGSMEEVKALWSREMVLIDVSDAFPHLGVHARELEHCLAPAVDDSGDFILFRALLFGFKTAPLLWSRVAAWTARMLQSCVQSDEGQHQVYLDDSFWCLQGSLARRNHLLAFIVYTMSAIGLEVSARKGERGDKVVWAGVEFRLVDPNTVLLTLPEKFLSSVETILKGWNKGLAPLKELRTVTGKISWLSGVLVRAKWVLRIFYAVLSAREAELRSGEEDRRRQNRADQRDKSAFFPVKRLEAGRLALLEFLAVTKERPTRKITLSRRSQAEVTVATDASPEGLGAVLIVKPPADRGPGVTRDGGRRQELRVRARRGLLAGDRGGTGAGHGPGALGQEARRHEARADAAVRLGYGPRYGAEPFSGHSCVEHAGCGHRHPAGAPPCRACAPAARARSSQRGARLLEPPLYLGFQEPSEGPCRRQDRHAQDERRKLFPTPDTGPGTRALGCLHQGGCPGSLAGLVLRPYEVFWKKGGVARSADH